MHDTQTNTSGKSVLELDRIRLIVFEDIKFIIVMDQNHNNAEIPTVVHDGQQYITEEQLNYGDLKVELRILEQDLFVLKRESLNCS